jgi:alpha-D-xyloside xylohydrolase
MIKRIAGAFILLCTLLSVQAQDFQKTKLGLKTTVQSQDIEIQFYSPTIVRVIKSPHGIPFKKESLSVNKKPQAPNLEISQKGEIVSLKSQALTVDLNVAGGKIEFKNKDGILIRERDRPTQFSPVKDVNRDTYRVRQSFLLDKDEAIYGLGQQMNGRMNQRGQYIYMLQQNMKVAIPFIHSIKGYGLFWDNYSPTHFTDSDNETFFDSEVGDCADYYFMYGGNADGVIAQMRDLTGQAPLMPMWTFGFSQSRERYKTQNELLEVVEKYRSLKVPLDGIIQDWQYWGSDSNWNAMSFQPNIFPDPKGMVDKVHQMNAHIFIVAWPGVGPKTKQYAEFKEKNMLINFDTWPPKGGVKPYDVYNPKARGIYWDYLNKGIFSLGADAWWLDSSEPDHINFKPEDFDQPTYLGSFRSVRNAFPLQHVGGVYDNQRKVSSDKRVSILTRSAFAGQQRYGANTWSGDVGSNWQTFRKQISAGLNFSLSGIPYWNTDIGGFFAGSFVKGGGAKNPDFQELYVRWMQFATFTPLMRSHGTDIPREIYQFGERGSWPFDVQEKFINLRYSLIPYTYSTAWNVTHNSGSFIRALMMDFPKDKKAINIDNQFMFGRSILVTPITDKGVKTQPVYLPAGTKWIDFWTGDNFDGGTTIDKASPIDILPLYIKAGSIIPWGPKVQFAEEKKWDNLEVRIYPGADADFTLYEDEGNSYNYEKGQFSEVHFHWDDSDKLLSISDRKGNFPGMLKNRKFNFVWVDKENGIGTGSSKADKSIVYKGKRIIVKM